VTSFARRLAAAAAVVSFVASVPGAASASPATLKRSISNITMAPVDLALSPVMAGMGLVRGLQEQDDSVGVKLAYPIPGFVWLTMLQAGSSVLRLITGVFEFVPGLLLLPFDADLEPLFDPSSENDALVDLDLVVYQLRFGIDYTSAPI
jgi:hypothetical protein